jgi:Fe-only nitrogenase accessory protein AnfO
MEKIAVYVSTTGVTDSIKEKGTVRIYAKNINSWIITKEIPCCIDFSAGLPEARKEITKLLHNITDCSIFAAAEISGQLYYLLEANGYSSYETEGEPEQYLDSILEAEQEEASTRMSKDSASTAKIIQPEPTGQPGVYSINLRRALVMNPSLSSKMILKPFLFENKFDVLEVLCDHVPRWFETDLNVLGLNLMINHLCENEYKITITRKVM